MLDNLLEAFGRLKQARALLDYDDLILKTRDLLEAMRADGATQLESLRVDGG